MTRDEFLPSLVYCTVLISVLFFFRSDEVTFEEFLTRLFPSFGQKAIRDMCQFVNHPPIKKLTKEQLVEIQILFTK